MMIGGLLQNRHAISLHTSYYEYYYEWFVFLVSVHQFYISLLQLNLLRNSNACILAVEASFFFCMYKIVHVQHKLKPFDNCYASKMSRKWDGKCFICTNNRCENYRLIDNKRIRLRYFNGIKNKQNHLIIELLGESLLGALKKLSLLYISGIKKSKITSSFSCFVRASLALFRATYLSARVWYSLSNPLSCSKCPPASLRALFLSSYSQREDNLKNIQWTQAMMQHGLAWVDGMPKIV